MSELLQFLISGITVGAIYSVVALGFTVIYNSSGVVNFAQGEFVMLGAMLSVAGTALGLPLVVAVMLAILAAALLSVALYDLAIRPARGAPMFALIIITIGASILIRGIAKIFFGTSPQALPTLAGDTPIRIGGAVLQTQSLVVVFGAVLMFAGLHVLMTRTLVGRAVGVDDVGQRAAAHGVKGFDAAGDGANVAAGRLHGRLVAVAPAAFDERQIGAVLGNGLRRLPRDAIAEGQTGGRLPQADDADAQFGIAGVLDVVSDLVRRPDASD